ncbi:MAG: hypothetical protein HYR84_16900, partial [Planctomycetes bacterium]|nr:hypothetical protein [Planctomycetota bacterium]
MAIATKCPKCQALYRLDDEMAGETVRCQSCQGIFEVPKAVAPPPSTDFAPAEIEEEPVAAAIDDGPDESRKASPAAPSIKRPSSAGGEVSVGMTVALVLVIGVGLVSCLGCFVGVGWWYLSLQGNEVPVVAAEKKAPDKLDDAGAKAKEPGKKGGGKGLGPPPPPPPPPIAKAKDMLIVFQPDGSFRAESALVANDGLNGMFKRYKGYRSVLEQGATYQIDMISDEFDAYLFLVDGAGIVVAKDDNSGGNRNAQIVFTSTRNGSFSIEATSANGIDLGRFTLTVRRIKR